jgi:hypothetical protein
LEYESTEDYVVLGRDSAVFFLKLAAKESQLREALYGMVEFHPPIFNRIGTVGSEARYRQSQQEYWIDKAKAALAEED